MLNFNNAPKKATNLSLNSKVLEKARELGMNVSQTVDALLAAEVRRRGRIQRTHRARGLATD
jgi:antitoxin CcdA